MMKIWKRKWMGVHNLVTANQHSEDDCTDEEAKTIANSLHKYLTEKLEDPSQLLTEDEQQDLSQILDELECSETAADVDDALANLYDWADRSKTWAGP